MKIKTLADVPGLDVMLDGYKIEDAEIIRGLFRNCTFINCRTGDGVLCFPPDEDGNEAIIMADA